MYGRVIIRDQHWRIVFCQEAANANRRHDLRVPAAYILTIFKILSHVLYHYHGDDVIRIKMYVYKKKERKREFAK